MLEQRLKRVLLKRGGAAVALWGEPGIGKSHAAAQLLRQTPCLSLSVHATTSLPTLASQLPRARDLPGWARATLSQLEMNAAVAVPRALEAIAAALAHSAPFVLLLEDLHEADSEREGVVSGLAAMVRRSRGVALLVTSRTDPGDAFEQIRMSGLSRAETRELVMGAVGARLPDDALEWIAVRAEGNPLFALEFARHLTRQGHLWSDGRTWHWRKPTPAELPPSVEALIEHFFMSVSGDAELLSVLETKALLPHEAGADLEAHVAGLTRERFEVAVRELERRGVFGHGAFVHPLYREVMRKSVPASERKRLARRALSATPVDAARVAALIDDADLAPTDAVRELEAAAAAAQATGNDLLAARLLAKASERATGVRAGELALAAAKLLDDKDYPRMLELAELAGSKLTDPTEALYLQATGLAVKGDHEGMQAVLRKLPPEAKRGTGWLQHYVRLLHQATRREELIAAWEASEDRDLCDAATVHFVGWAYLHSGAPSAAEALVDERLARGDLDAKGRSALIELQASIAFYGGDYPAAEATYSELLALALATPGVPKHRIANLLRNRAVIRMQLARHASSLADLNEALKLYEEIGHGHNYAKTLVMLSYAHLELGDYERSEDVLYESLGIVERSGVELVLSDTLSQLCELYLEWPGGSRPSLALKYGLQAAEAAAADPTGIENVTARCLLSRAKTAMGSPLEGLVLAEWTLAEVLESEIVEAVIAARFARACALEALGRQVEARDEFAGAAKVAWSRGLAVYAHRCGLEVDRLDDDRASAAQRSDWSAEHGLRHGVNLARQYFPELAASTDGSRLASETAPRLEVLGPMRLRRDAATTPVKGRRRRALLLALLDARLAGRPGAERLELLDALYPGAAEAKASGSLKQLISDLRKDVGPGAVVTTTEGYALGAIGSDAEEFLATGDTAAWRGLYGEGVELDVRESVQGRLYAALFAAAEARLDADAAETVRLAELLRRHDPYSRESLGLSLAALMMTQRPRTVAEAYERAASTFAEVGEVLPDSWEAFVRSVGREPN